MNLIIDKLDEKLFLALNGGHVKFLDYIMLTASSLFTFIPVFLLCIYITIKYFRKQDDRYYTFINIILLISVLAIQYFICSYLLDGMFKSLFYRDRPCVNPNISSFVRMLGRDCNPNNHSLFAYKACLIFCLTSFLFFTIKEGFRGIKWILLAWSILVAYSRVYVGSHYPVNVLISATTGVVAGYLVNRLYLYLKYNLLVI
jgi:undecaprenyl-diphosphatase